MNKILCCDWLSCPLGITGKGCPARKKLFFMPYDKSFIDQDCLVKVAGYWPSSVFFYVFMIKVIKTQKLTWPISRQLDLVLGQ